jgi:predicted RecA/RadA family phage recombinase
MSGFELKNNRFSSLGITNPSTEDTYAAGQLVEFGHLVCVVVEAVGTSGAAASATYPNGPRGVMVYRAEKIVVNKATDVAIDLGARVYIDAEANHVTTSASGNAYCGLALESAATSATRIAIDLDGLNPA